MQEKSTYYDVQLLRQPTKNEKRKLVPGAPESPAPAGAVQPGSAERVSLSQSMDKAAPGTAGMRDSMGRQQMSQSFEHPASVEIDKQFVKPAQQTAQRNANPSAPSNPALSQSFEQRSVQAPKSMPNGVSHLNQLGSPAQPQQPTSGGSPQSAQSVLRTSVDHGINNVDRALSEMHRQEGDRLRVRIEVC